MQMKKENKIFIIGAGAIGKVLAVCLQVAGKEVVLLRGSVDHVPSHTEHIQVLREQAPPLEAGIMVSSISRHLPLDGLIILANKSYGNTGIAQLLEGHTGNSPLVVMQNGLDVEQPFTARGFPHIYRCVLLATSQAVGENRYRFKPVDASPVGVTSSPLPQTGNIVSQLDTEYFRFRAAGDIQPVTWKKAIINSVFNSICPLLDTDNGIFHRSGEALSIARRIVREGIYVAATRQVHLEEEDVVNVLLAISKASDGQLISTLQDIRHGRETEISTLNGAIAGIATANGLQHHAIETGLLGELILLKSAIHRSS